MRLAIRSLLKDRAFSWTVVFTLALAIGVNTTTFAIVNSVLLKPLPVPEGERIVLISNQYPGAGIEWNDTSSSGDFFDRRKGASGLADQALYRVESRTVDLEGRPTRVTGMKVTPSLFQLMRTKPVAGRVFEESEGVQGNDKKLVLTAGLARELFGGESMAVGRRMRLEGVAYEVVGVMPGGFRFVEPEVRFWVPAAFSVEDQATHHNNGWRNVAKLKAGLTLEQAQAQIDAINAANLERFAEMKQILLNARFHSLVEPLQEVLVRQVKQGLFLLWGGALLVLLIGGINVANLALARMTARRKEFATRMAIGAGRGVVIRQLMVENVSLALAGGVLGIGLGVGMLELIAKFGLNEFPRAWEVGIDWSVVVLSTGLAILAGCIVTLMPLVAVFRTNLQVVLHEDGRGGGAGMRAKRTRQGLVAFQVATAFALLAGAGVLFESFRQLSAVKPGFRLDGVMTASVEARSAKYQKPAERRKLAARTLEAIRALPEVAAAAVSDTVPFSGQYNDSVVIGEGYQMAPGESVVSPRQVHVSSGYFEAMDIELVKGRYFQPSDNENGPDAVIVDEKLAKRFWKGRDAVGMRMRFPQDEKDLMKVDEKTKWMTVVGVVKDTRLEDLKGGSSNSVGTYYLPFEQAPSGFLAFYVRGKGVAGDPLRLVGKVREAIAGVDPELALSGVKTMRQRAEDSLSSRRATMVMAMGFAGLAVFLAALGIYGMLAYAVVQRRREIGVRLALGGDAARIVVMVLRESVWLAGVGLVVGVGGAVGLSAWLRNEVYGVRPLEPVVLGCAGVIVILVALIAGVLPARRAAGVDPAEVLRG